MPLTSYQLTDVSTDMLHKTSYISTVNARFYIKLNGFFVQVLRVKFTSFRYTRNIICNYTTGDDINIFT